MKKLILILAFAFLGGGLYGMYEQKNNTNNAVEKQKDTKAKTLNNKADEHVETIATSERPQPLIKKTSAQINDVPLIMQLPELQRGCEVTSLAMMLQHAGAKVGKMELADNIKKNPTRYKHVNGAYYYGNPNDGFVGDIYTFKNMGYGVYHKPVAELAEKYLPGRIQDISGSSFEDVLKHVADGRPVWIIINSNFAPLVQSEFRTWNTPTGQVQITWKEHSVVITGYDKTHVYINDPLVKQKPRKLPIENFKAAWEQMGSQAITYK